jgi:integrase
MEMETKVVYDKPKVNKITLLSKYANHFAFRNFMVSLRSDSTRESYSYYFYRFLKHNPKYINLTLDEILKVEPKELEKDIIETIIKMKEEECLSSSSTNLLAASLIHFFSINDVLLNRKKISKFIGEQQNKFEYRSYTHEEISKLLSILDERGKAAVLLMASTGMRVGGLAEIRLKHIQRCYIDDFKENYVYKIIVYGSSSRHKHTTFSSPEAAKALDEYLNMRKRHNEKLKQDPETGNWTPGETPVIIRQFNKIELNHKVSPMKSSSITLMISQKLGQLGIRNNIVMPKPVDPKRVPGLYRYNLHPCHSLRIFFVCQMQRARIDKTIREMLVGHSTGLDRFYLKMSDDEILQEFVKGIDALTIQNEHRLQKQLDHYKRKSEEIQEIRQQLDKNYEQKIEIMKIEMENKFKQLVDKVNITQLCNNS